MFSDELKQAASSLIDTMRQRGLMMATAESCTGGLIAGLITEIAGSSDVFDRGFVTYSNNAKHQMLGVPEAMLETYGAVSEPVAHAMAEGALKNSRADIAIAVTGIAGPGGGSVDKPVGLVHIAVAHRHHDTLHQACRFGDIGRDQVRLETVKAGLVMLEEVVAYP